LWSVLLQALRKMELRIGEVLEVRATEYATDRTTAFDWDPCCVQIDEAPILDTDYLDVKPIYASSFTNLDDRPIFDEEPFVDPVFNVAPNSDCVAATVLNFTTSACVVHDQGNPDDLDNNSVFNTDTDTNSDTLVDGPVFDIETDYNHVVIAAIEFTESVFDADFAFSDKGPGGLTCAHRRRPR
jgi:hypothetical protein